MNKFFFLIMAVLLIFSSMSQAESKRERIEDLNEQRLILEEHANFLNDEQIQSGEFKTIMAKIDAIDEELKEQMK